MKKYVNLDGNSAVSKVAYYFSEVAAIYPITPSSAMAEQVDEFACQNRKNLFGLPVTVKQLQSEAGASGAVHGSLVCGALTTTFTASQGLLLMIPNMYKIAGELLPSVFHVSARALATHALSIFGDHSDVMAVRSTGFNMLASSNVQECQDMAVIAHIASIDCSLPFLHFFDGFRTSHEVQKIVDISDDDLEKLVDFEKIQEFKARALNPTTPHQQGTAQNPDIYFQNREACNPYYANAYDKVLNAFDKFEKVTGRKYAPFEYYGDTNAEYIIVSMASSTETIKEYIDFANKNGKKYGLINVRLYRPFNNTALTNILPKTAKVVSVLDRTKECGASYEPLCQDVISAFSENDIKAKVLGGRYGLGGKEFTPNCVKAIFDNMENDLKNHFTVGIVDDVSNSSLEIDEEFKLIDDNYTIKLFGLGSDGTVSASKNTIKIIGENTDKYVQGYFEYDSKKSGSLTISHLRVSKTPIKSTYLTNNADFIGIHNFSFVNRYDLLSGLKENGTVLINTILPAEELDKHLPADFKSILINKKAKLYTINAQSLALDLGLGNKINILMQSAFFKLSNVIDFEEAKKCMENAIKKTYAKKGEKVVNANIQAINSAIENIKEVSLDNLTKNECLKERKSNNEYYNSFVKPIDELKGNALPVSKFSPDGYVPTDTAKYQKRGVAEFTPNWIKEKCIQCGLCSAACPHACLRGVLVNKNDLKDKPETFDTKTAMAKPDLEYRLQLSPLDCTGCGVCASVCPVKALEMELASKNLEAEIQNQEYSETLNILDNEYKGDTAKTLQFKKPYFEYNYACAGCGETPYIKILTQLFGNKMVIANATGCSSIYGGSAPACPYAKDCHGNGPAWANSLFEDNAEFGLGMRYAINNEQNYLKKLVSEYLEEVSGEELKLLLNDFLNDRKYSQEECRQIIELLKNEKECQLKTKILEKSKYFADTSVWIIGGDGWAYDIGYGGLDHLLSSDENVNVLVLDSEVYSNTGGQSSKSTPRGASAKFSANGKITKKKDLASIAIANHNAYVAQISLGADVSQTIKAFKEAESFNGPSIIIAYSPCVNHGFNMKNSNAEMKKAVECGYWNLFRYNPQEDKFNLDSRKPTQSYEDFLLGETRYSSLYKKNPELAKKLFEESSRDAMIRYEKLLKMSENNE